MHEGIVEFSHMVSTRYDCTKRGSRGDSPQFHVTKLVVPSRSIEHPRILSAFGKGAATMTTEERLDLLLNLD